MKLDEFWRRDKAKIGLQNQARDAFRDAETYLEMLVKDWEHIEDGQHKHVVRKARQALREYGKHVYKLTGQHPNK